MSESKRYVLFPFAKSEEAYGNSFLEQHNLHWSFGEFDFMKDRKDYEKLSPELRNIFDVILAYFAFTDGIIAENCIDVFSKTARSIECKAAYAVQAYIEYIHAMVYSRAIEAYIQDEKKREQIFNSYILTDAIQAKTKWTEKYMNPELPEEERLVSFACTEGIFFISAFAFIFYLKSKDLFPQFGSANQSISKDESKHAELSILRYNTDYANNRLPEERVHEIVRTAVSLEQDFINTILPNTIDDLIPEEIKGYVEVLADGICYNLGYSKIYNTSMKIIPNWLSIISLQPKHNFYEVLPQNYAQFSTEELNENLDLTKENLEDVDF